MSWATMRTALCDRIRGTQITVPQYETLNAFEWAPAGRQDLLTWPYCFPLPTGRSVVRWGGTQRKTTSDLAVRIMLAPTGTEDMESLHQRYDAWCEALAGRFDGKLAFGQAINQFDNQDFGGLSLFEDIERGWGFDMTFGTVDFDETVELGG